MEHSQKKLAQNAAVYSFFTLLQRGLGFFLLPVYTTVLATEQLGIISTTTAVISFFVLLFGLSLRGSTAYYYYEYIKTDNAYLKRIFGTNTLFILIATVIGIGLVLLTKQWVLDRLLENIAFSPYIILALCSILLQPLYFFYQSLLKAQQKAKKAAGLDFIYFGLMIGLTLIFILGFKMKAEGALLANAIASFVVFAKSFWGLKGQITFCLDKKILKKTLKYSLPVLPHNLAGWAMNLADRVMLNSMGSLSLVGIFDVGSQLGKVVNIISLGVNSAYSPWFFDQVKNRSDRVDQIANVTNKIVLFYAFIAVAISWLSPEIISLIAKDAYNESWTVVPLIAIAFVINGFYFTFSNVFFLDKTKYLPALSISGALINLALNFWLIPIYGLMGAAIASIATKLLFTIITFLLSQRLYYIPYNLLRIAITIGLALALACIPYWLQDKLTSFNIFAVTLVKAIVLLLFAIPIVLINLKQIKQIISQRHEA